MNGEAAMVERPVHRKGTAWPLNRNIKLDGDEALARAPPIFKQCSTPATVAATDPLQFRVGHGGDPMVRPCSGWGKAVGGHHNGHRAAPILCHLIETRHASSDTATCSAAPACEAGAAFFEFA